MNSAFMDRVDRIFYEARQLPADCRMAFLEQACGENREVRQEVNALLASADEVSDTFLEKPLLSLNRRPEELPEGSRIGIYRVRRKIGSGGMGTVYLAARDDEEYEQEVAVKVLLDRKTEELIRRFRHERQILARLHHPYIAAIFDGGTTPDGLPYFVMEYIEGEPIHRHCDEHQLPIRERLELFCQVCSAVHYAHQNLVLHLDLKPANILITRQREPKLLDFGVAKLLEPGEASPTDVVGPQPMTPRYASPEQLRDRPVTTTSDVYSLGTVLYELLAGRAPCLSGPMEQEPEPPSVAVGRGEKGCRPEQVSADRGVSPRTLERLLRSDLDWITMKAMAMEPARRYSSPAALAADIGRHLRHEPVVASPPSTAYRMRKFVRRYRAVVASALLIVLALASGLVGVTREASRTAREAEKARQIKDFVVRLFEVSDPWGRREYGADEDVGNSVTARKILEVGAERIHEELADQPLIRATMLDTIGDVYGKLGLYPQALTQLEEALAIRRDLLAEDDPDLGRSLHLLAQLERQMGNYDRSEELYEEAIEVRKRGLGSDDAEVGDSLNGLAYVAYTRGDYERAEELFHRATAIREKAFGEDALEVADSLNDLALVYREQASFESAEKLLVRVLEIQRGKLPQDHPALGLTYNALAGVHWQLGDFERAMQLLNLSLEVAQKTLGPDHPIVASGLDNLATIYRELGEYAVAIRLQQRALKIFRKALGQEHPDVAKTLHNLAELYRDRGELSKALELYTQALETWRPLRHSNLATSLHGLSSVHWAMGEGERAAELLIEALSIRREALGEEHPKTGETMTALAEIYAEEGRTTEARDMLIEAADTFDRALAADSDCRECLSALARNHLVLGLAADREENPQRARVEWSRSLEIVEPLVSGSRSVRYQRTQALALLLLARVEEARPVVVRLLKLGWRDRRFLELCGRYGFPLEKAASLHSQR